MTSRPYAKDGLMMIAGAFVLPCALVIFGAIELLAAAGITGPRCRLSKHEYRQVDEQNWRSRDDFCIYCGAGMPGSSETYDEFEYRINTRET